MENLVDVHGFARDAMGALLAKVLEGVKPSDKVGIEVKHPGLQTDILIPLLRRDKLNADTIAQYIADVEQSRGEFSLDEQMQWKFTIVEDTSGAGSEGA
jgi:hypothetical protein